MKSHFSSELDDLAGPSDTASDHYVTEHRVTTEATQASVAVTVALVVAVASFIAGAWVATWSPPAGPHVVAAGARTPTAAWQRSKRQVIEEDSVDSEQSWR